MERRVTRRTLLTGAASVAVAGCTAGGGDDGGSGDGDGDGAGDLPESCPTTQDLDVEWPDELTAETVAAFVEAYDEAYSREIVVAYEPSSRLDEFGLSSSVHGDVTEHGDGYVASVNGGGGVYTPHLLVVAEVTTAPADAERVPFEAVEDETLRSVIEDAREAAEGADADDREAHRRIGPGRPVDEHLDRLASLFEGFDGLEDRYDEATLYVGVEDTDVELSVSADSFHGDYGWHASYYVDEDVLRRSTDEGTDPGDGELLECRDVA